MFEIAKLKIIEIYDTLTQSFLSSVLSTKNRFQTKHDVIFTGISFPYICPMYILMCYRLLINKFPLKIGIIFLIRTLHTIDFLYSMGTLMLT